ncbi:MAG: hypothetical protein R2772_07455 [Chitinophagales bacterium]
MNKSKYILLLLFVVLQFGLFCTKKAKKDKEVQVVATAISNEARLKAERLFSMEKVLVGNEEAYVLFMQAVQINPALMQPIMN